MAIKGFPVHSSENSTYLHLMSSKTSTGDPRKVPSYVHMRKRTFQHMDNPSDAANNSCCFFHECITLSPPTPACWQDQSSLIKSSFVSVAVVTPGEKNKNILVIHHCAVNSATSFNNEKPTFSAHFYAYNCK
ncbi:hypothetical protein ABVT39_007703, partial [Epinephelus coioides]